MLKLSYSCKRTSEGGRLRLHGVVHFLHSLHTEHIIAGYMLDIYAANRVNQAETDRTKLNELRLSMRHLAMCPE